MSIAELSIERIPITSIAEKYRVVRVLGVGGMGTVYEAENEWTGRRVAIKLLRPDLSEVPTFVQRFMQEAKAATSIRHTNIVDVLDMGRDAGTGSFFIVQEYLEGEDLGAWMRDRRRISARDAVVLLLPVMEALAAAHDRGIVHRDIKPENILLAKSPSGEIVPKIIDFGISKIAGQETDLRMTHTGIAIGTPEYMSPEQARGDDSIDGQTDIWSLGVVIYELLSGWVPFAAKNYNVVVARVLTEPVPRIETLVPDIDPSVAAIVHRALGRERNERYRTMREFIRDVRGCPAMDLASFAPATSRFDSSNPDRPTEEPKVTASGLSTAESSPRARPSLSLDIAKPRVSIVGAVAIVLAVGVLATRWAPGDAIASARPPRLATLRDRMALVAAPARNAPREATAPSPIAAIPTRESQMPRTIAREFRALPMARNVTRLALARISDGRQQWESTRPDPARAVPMRTITAIPVIPPRTHAPPTILQRHHINVE